MQRKSFRSLRTATATADDGEDVAVEEAESRGQHPAEVGDSEQCQRNSNNSVEHRHHHPCCRLRRYVTVTYHTTVC